MTTQAPSKSTIVSSLLARVAQHRQPEALAAPPNHHSWYALGLALRLAFFVGLIAHSLTLLSRW
jgi:hypothetical protein